jgi:DNA repair protein RadC
MTTLKTLDRTPRLAELKVTYKRRLPRKPPPTLTSVIRAEAYLRTIWDEDTIDLREEFVVLCLDASLAVLGWVRLHAGGLDSSPVDPRLVFGVALKAASAGILVAHNHPARSLAPSSQDVAITRRLADGARLLGLRFVDHVILTRAGCFSFDEAGMLSRDA